MAEIWRRVGSLEPRHCVKR